MGTIICDQIDANPVSGKILVADSVDVSGSVSSKGLSTYNGRIGTLSVGTILNFLEGGDHGPNLDLIGTLTSSMKSITSLSVDTLTTRVASLTSVQAGRLSAIVIAANVNVSNSGSFASLMTNTLTAVSGAFQTISTVKSSCTSLTTQTFNAGTINCNLGYI